MNYNTLTPYNLGLYFVDDQKYTLAEAYQAGKIDFNKAHDFFEALKTERSDYDFLLCGDLDNDLRL